MIEISENRELLGHPEHLEGRKKRGRCGVCGKREDTDTRMGQVCRVVDVKAAFDSLKER